MRYDEMKRRYPWIDGYFALIADQIHTGAALDMELLTIQIGGRVSAAHCRPVLEKLAQFAKVAQDNKRFIARRNRSGCIAPDGCPHCGSIDTQGGICAWCHNNLLEVDSFDKCPNQPA